MEKYFEALETMGYATLEEDLSVRDIYENEYDIVKQALLELKAIKEEKTNTEVKLYTMKEAKEIIKKHPDKILRTKRVVVDLVKDKDDTDHEKRMYYIIELIHKGCYIYSVLFKEKE